eukprot:jgi/Astpho2/7358/fgenesh1_pm.00114_%23_6_t
MGGCASQSKTKTNHPGQPASPQEQDYHEQLAGETHFTVDEVYALEELFKNLSSSLHQDGVINRDEFNYAMFKTLNQSNIFVEKVFELFDSKKTNVIDFSEFTLALSVFHPKAPLQEKAAFAFRIYDLDNTGHIERDEVKRFLTALLKDNPAIALDDDQLETIMDQTFKEADLAGDGHISPEEWQILVNKNPTLINYMTLPMLKDLTKTYPSFCFAKR